MLSRVTALSSKCSACRRFYSVQSVSSAVHELTDTVCATRVRGLANTLELSSAPESSIKPGSPLPRGWSLVLFPPVWTPTSALGDDGCEPSPLHLATSDVAATSDKATPDVLERMWVSGSFAFERPSSEGQPGSLVIGEEAHCHARVTDIKERTGKDGRTGWYVETERIMRGASSGAEIKEVRVHLYRAPLASQPTKTAAPPKGNVGVPMEKKKTDWCVDWISDQKHLFRFSALTFNTHFIHWNKEYCVNQEKRPGLIVHGPLTALLALHHANDAGRERGLELKKFEYRNTAPMVVDTPVQFCGSWTGEKTADIWVGEKDSPPVFLKGSCEYF